MQLALKGWKFVSVQMPTDELTAQSGCGLTFVAADDALSESPERSERSDAAAKARSVCCILKAGAL